MNDWEKIDWKNFEIRRLVNFSMELAPSNLESENWKMCRRYFSILELQQRMSLNEFISTLVHSHSELTVTEFWPLLMAAQSSGWVEIVLCIPGISKESEMSWDGVDSIHEWR